VKAESWLTVSEFCEKYKITKNHIYQAYGRSIKLNLWPDYLTKEYKRSKLIDENYFIDRRTKLSKLQEDAELLYYKLIDMDYTEKDIATYVASKTKWSPFEITMWLNRHLFKATTINDKTILSTANVDKKMLCFVRHCNKLIKGKNKND